MATQMQKSLCIGRLPRRNEPKKKLWKSIFNIKSIFRPRPCIFIP